MRRFLKLGLKAAATLAMSCALLAHPASLSASESDQSHLGGGSSSSDSSRNRLRVDCRFYSEHSGFCYASAIYSVDRWNIDSVRFGVGCNYETLYDDGATVLPQEEVSDSIRPLNAALPRVAVAPEGSLRRPGTYTSTLETEHGRLTDGVCYVRRVGENESEMLLNAIEYGGSYER